MTRLVFLGGKNIAARCFDQVLGFARQKEIELLCVLCSPRGDELRNKANEHGISVLDTADQIPQCDILLSVQYHQILTEQQLSKVENIAINLHLAPLPEYRGCNQFSLAILNNDSQFGVTLHAMDAKIDHGDILFEKRFEIPDGIWVQDLVKLADDKGVELFEESLANILIGDFIRIDQSTRIEEYGTSLNYRKQIEELKYIDLQWSKDKIERTIRGTYMPGFAPPFTRIGDKKLNFRLEADD